MPPEKSENDMSNWTGLLKRVKKSKVKNLRPSNNFSKTQLLVFIVVFGTIGGYLLYRGFAASPVVASVEAENLVVPAGASVISDASASGGKAVQFISAGTSSGSVSAPSPVASITLNAKASKCKGSWPSFSLVIDGQTVLSANVTSTGWYAYSITTSLPSGTHSLSLNATIPSAKGKSSACVPVLYVDNIVFYGNTPPPTPAPTVALSASPTAVLAGSASSLTWSSTNATSCSASGAWSGAEPTSGSVTTGALNSTSTYSLSCAGAGGTANASVTVSVSSPTGYSANRWVYGMGMKDATYNGSGPGWWSGGTSTGWVRLPTIRSDNNHADFVRDGSVDLMAGMMQSVNGWFNTGTSVAPTVRLTLYPTDTDDKGGYTAGAQQHVVMQAYDHRQSPNGVNGSDVEQSLFGSQPDFGAAPGQDWYYGWTFSTNPEYTVTTNGTGWWNGVSHDFHVWGLTTPGGNEEAQFGIATRATQGATTGTVYTVKDNATYLLADGPHIAVAVNGGNADHPTDYASATDLTMYRIIGPKWVAGQKYSIAYHIKWDAYLNGTFEWWVNGVKYGSLTNIGTLWRNTSGTIDVPYPQWENYWAYDPSNTVTHSIYYGAFIKGSSLTDVTIP